MAKINFEDAVIKIIKRYLVSFGKSLASKFYTKKQVDTMILPIPAIQTDIDSLKARSVIGSKLSFGSFDIDTSKTGVNPTLSANYKIPFKIKSGSLIVDSNGYIKLEKGKSYNLNFFATSNARFDFQFFNVTDSIGVGKTIISGSTISGSGSYSMDVTKDIYITVMVTYKEGTMLFTDYCELTIQEIGRNTIIDPCEDGKNINFEYGSFAVDIAGHNITGLGAINFNRMLSGNIMLNTSTLAVKLKANKTYSINYSLVGEYVNLAFALKDITKGITISTSQGAKGYNLFGDGHEIYTPTIDCEIRLEVTGYISGGIIRSESRLLIQEIAQPYYFNYYKDSIASNIIFDGNANKVGNFQLLDNVNKYDYLIIQSYYSNIVKNTIVTKYDYSKDMEINYTTVTQRRMLFNISENMLNITQFLNTDGYAYSITKVLGVGYSYDNPYQDIITTAPDAALTDSAVDSDITSIWSGVGL
ncbi:hypothetical protein [Clostridium sp. YIM B02555]|uniref:hypothetical protein n=1 Tax=Clostridium sp. YIM B02555 TaxID=2911968 RepID=UPI001EEE0F5A|nr:hypothetical protein [Clostridium sp. YIM B02555]